MPRPTTPAPLLRTRATTAATVATLVLLATPLSADTTVVGFDNGLTAGWFGPAGNDGQGGGTSVPSTGGNPTWNMRTVFNNFGITFFNNSNPDFLGDFSDASSVTIAIDLRVEVIRFFGQNVSRPWLVELRDLDGAVGGYPWNSVWFKFAQVSAATHGQWTRFTVTFDPRSTTMPAGWGGTGWEHPVTYEPMLPPGVTFADVLKGVDAIAFTTFEPGFVFGFTDHTMRIDNITITRTPAVNPADLDGDGVVNAADLAALLGAWGGCPSKAACVADLDGDGVVGASDLAALLSSWS